MGLFFNYNPGGSAQENPEKVDRKPVAAGRFYPADPKELRSVLAGLFSDAKPKTTRNVIGIVSPHAGYVYSGKVAASGYNQLDPDRDFENVFVIASSHQVSFPGASVYNRGDYITPLGKVEVNIDLANELIGKNPALTFNPEADRTEHSLEVQIPFLQYHLKHPFKLVPIVIGTQSEAICLEIAKALKPWFNERNLFVFSTDFSHYPSYSDAMLSDQATCDAILSGSTEKLMKFLNESKDKSTSNLMTNLCGWTSILVMLDLIDREPDLKISPVQYLNSGDSKYGDKAQVVGYWSLALSRSDSIASQISQAPPFMFTRDEKTVLLKIARNTIEKYIREGRIPDDNPASYSESLKIHAGAFVTLKDNGRLRGCIGKFTADIPLYKLVRQMAAASSTEDNRFEPVKINEIKQLEIEISVLSPLKLISSPDEVILGKHGIYMKKGPRLQPKEDGMLKNFWAIAHAIKQVLAGEAGRMPNYSSMKPVCFPNKISTSAKINVGASFAYLRIGGLSELQCRIIYFSQNLSDNFLEAAG
ncbi:MAG: AmmeMemoRadiSam system protein B [Bacteroidetes bacterium]|nr:AmmeMemoRadiSam system protein B [Bacteroidota bacterium]